LEKPGASDPHPSPEKDVVFSPGVDGKYVAGWSVETEQPGATIRHEARVAAVDSSSEGVASISKSRAIKRRRRKSLAGKSASVSEGLPVPAAVDPPRDELTVLYDENRQLKCLLAEHLLQQNTELRKRLARFGDI
jgi:hypothetical protein